MRFQTYKDLGLYAIKKLLLMSSIFLTISAVNADPKTINEFPPISVITANEIIYIASQDNRFGSAKNNSYGENLEWSSDWDLTWLDFDFSENRVVRIFHVRNKQDLSLKYTNFYDPDTNAWTTWVRS